MKRIETSISPNYVPDWSIGEAVREIVQNTIDEDGDIEYEDGILTLTTHNGAIPVSMLALGNSGKRGDSSKIGRHGDGLKTALAVILRENYHILIKNGNVLWQPKIAKHSQLDCDCVVIEENPLPGATSNDVVITISDISDCVDEISEMSLQLDQIINGVDLEVVDTDYGRLIYNEELKGNIYVNGLFIQNDNNLKYGFDFEAAYVHLDRDRKAINYYEMLKMIARVVVSSADVPVIIECLYDERTLEHEEVISELYEASDEVKNDIVDDYCLTKTRRKVPLSKTENATIAFENVICVDEDTMDFLKMRKDLMKDEYVYIVENNYELKDFINISSDDGYNKRSHLHEITCELENFKNKHEKRPYQLSMFNNSTYKKSVALINRFKKQKGIRKTDIAFLEENLVKKAPTSQFGDILKEINLEEVTDSDYVLEDIELMPSIK